jgi:hypothetical protein
MESVNDLSSAIKELKQSNEKIIKLLEDALGNIDESFIDVRIF